jgi:hypothetical protein
MPIHQYMYPKVTPVKTAPPATPPAEPPATGRSAQSR